MSQFEAFSSVERRIAYLMDIAGINTLLTLAHRSGVPIKTLRGLIKRNAIGPKTAERISKKLNIPYKWIKDGVGSPPSARMVAERAGDETFPSYAFVDPWTAGEHLNSLFDDPGRGAKTGVRMRIHAVAEAFGLETPLAFALAAGLSPDLLDKIMACGEIDKETAAFVAKRLGIECAWLLKGEGPMQKPGSEIEGYKGEPSGTGQQRLSSSLSHADREAHAEAAPIQRFAWFAKPRQSSVPGEASSPKKVARARNSLSGWTG